MGCFSRYMLTIPCFLSILCEKSFEGVQASTILDETVDVDLSANEVSYCSFVVVKRCDQEEIEEW